MDYKQTIDYLYLQLPMFSRIGAAAYKKDLHNTIALCSALNNPQNNFKSVHIAGTNGKGSTSHMLAAILYKAGYKTGLYTSPHLKDFRERIKVNGKMVDEEFVVNFVEKTKSLTEKIQPSFFELTVAMAFEYFSVQKVDIAIIETGLGGRLDSTNIITPILSIITNIGYDHMNILGNSLKEIAYEKAGIIKTNVPVVIGEFLPETKSVFEKKVAESNATLHFAQEEFNVANISSNNQLLHCTATNKENQIAESFSLDLNGFYQTKNLSTVLCAASILKKLGFKISNEDEKFALANTKKLTSLHGRWDEINQNPTIVIDVAHNEDGIKQVLTQLHWLKYNFEKIHFIIGMAKDKEVDKVLALLPNQSNYYFTNANNPRALPAEELKYKAKLFKLDGNSYSDVNIAIAQAKKNAANNDIIVICGSIFIAGEVNY